MKQKTAPWLPIDAIWWPNIAEALSKPWPESAVQMDLRWWADQESQGREKRPGRPALKKRWGWSDRKTRNAISSASSDRTTVVQPKSSSGTETKVDIVEIIRPGVQSKSNEGPAKVQRRSSPLIKQNTENKTEDKTILSDSEKKPPVVRKVFDQIVAKRQARMPGARPLKLTKSRAAAIKARLLEYSEQDLLAVVDWWLKAQHPRAQYLIENGHGIDTLMRASNFPKYLEFCGQPDEIKPKSKSWSVKVHPPPERKDLPPLTDFTSEQIEIATQNLAPLKSGCTEATWDKLLRTSLQQDFGAP